jgi:hypothetical protein
VIPIPDLVLCLLSAALRGSRGIGLGDLTSPDQCEGVLIVDALHFKIGRWMEITKLHTPALLSSFVRGMSSSE